MTTWTPLRRARAAKLFAAGATAAKVANALGLARGSVCWAARRYGLRPGSEPVFESQATGARKEDWSEGRLTERWADRKRKVA